MKHRHWLLAVSFLLTAGLALAGGGIALGLLDDFNDETTQGWGHGGASPNPPTVIPIGGPDGSPYLENFSSGSPGPGGRHIVLNSDSRWTGDYVAAGVNKIRVNIANFGDADLNMRVAFRRIVIDSEECWATTTAFDVPPDATWRNYEFLLDESTMTEVASSGGTLEDALRNVSELRLVSSAAPSCRGDVVFGISGFDDFQTDADTDLDGINNSIDNCTLVANPRQCIGSPSTDNQTDCELDGNTWGQPDTDGDLYGNHCDADIAPQPGPFPSGDCIVNFIDLNVMRDTFFASIGSPAYVADADMIYDGIVNFSDLDVVRQQFFSVPGPGLGNCGCAPDVANDQGVNAEFAGLKMFIRGGLVLDWGAVDGINNFVDLGNGNYQAKVQLNPGSYGYKVADFDWNIDYANEVDTTVPGGAAVTLNGRCGNAGFCEPGLVDEGQGNSPIDITQGGCYQFDMVAGAPDEDFPFEADTADITVTGPLP